jgi:hypothetical protein
MTDFNDEPHGNTGNRNNARDTDPNAENMTSKILFFCYPEEKSAWVRAAKPGKLSAWIRAQLNKATGRPETPDSEEWRQIRK